MSRPVRVSKRIASKNYNIGKIKKVTPLPRIEYIYLAEKKHHRVNRAKKSDGDYSIYKIGKTIQEGYKRINGYDKGTSLLLHMECENCNQAERELLIIFRQKFQFIPEEGRESFWGSKRLMKLTIISYLMKIDIPCKTKLSFSEICTIIYSCVICKRKKEWYNLNGVCVQCNKEDSESEDSSSDLDSSSDYDPSSDFCRFLI